jgi:hypothetical protein
MIRQLSGSSTSLAPRPNLAGDLQDEAAYPEQLSSGRAAISSPDELGDLRSRVAGPPKSVAKWTTMTDA